ncbi:MAG: hypothetical protein ACI9MR_004460 [Myxococcota bacterium]|jgi:hypothetical protein
MHPLRLAPACGACILISLSLALVSSACLEEETAPSFVIEEPVAPGSVSISIGALNLPEVTRAIYALSVKNNSGDVVNALTIDSADYGQGSGAATYVTPCDAAPSEQPSEVSVTLVQLFAGNQPVDAVLPPEAVRTVTCNSNADALLEFNMSVVRSAQLGFIDIKARLSDIFCSAALECQSAPASGSAARVVLGFACGAGPASEVDPPQPVETNLYMDDLVVTCRGIGTATIRPDGAGYLSAAMIDDPDFIVNNVRVFRGPESLDELAGLYWNVSFELTQWAAVADCTLATRATATDTDIALGPGGTAPFVTGDNYPLIDWNVPLTFGSAVTCSSHPVGGDTPNAGVAVGYPADGATFDNHFGDL